MRDEKKTVGEKRKRRGMYEHKLAIPGQLPYNVSDPTLSRENTPLIALNRPIEMLGARGTPSPQPRLLWAGGWDK